MRQLTRGSIMLEKDNVGKCTYVQVYTSTHVMRLIQVAALEELLANIPDVYPLLQTPIDWSREERGFNRFSPNSPSIDRIDNTKGACVVFSHFEQYFRIHPWKRLDHFQACQHHQKRRNMR